MWPRFKTGKRRDVRNKGIAKLSDIPRIMEKIVCGMLHSSEKALISKHQHGFMRVSSTTTNLIDFTSYVKTLKELGHQTDVILKLKKLGFNPNMILWIKSYLKNRKLYVKIGSDMSEQFEATSGIPQGSHLGPLIFIIFINDLVTFIGTRSRSLLFADDSKIFMKVSVIEDCIQLQEVINLVEEWCALNRLYLNVAKCKVMIFTRKVNGGIHFEYKIGAHILERVNLIKDLGVWFDGKMSFIENIDRIIAKAFAMLGFVIRCSKEFKDPYVLKSLYCCFVRSILEFSSGVWCPYYKVHISRIESIQKRFLKFALRDLGWRDRLILPPYTDRLQLLNMNTLEHRREVGMVMFMVKLLKGDIDAAHLLTQADVQLSNRTSDRRSCFFQIPHHRTNYGKYEPVNYMCILFNSFFDSVRLECSNDVIKKHLLSFKV